MVGLGLYWSYRMATVYQGWFLRWIVNVEKDIWSQGKSVNMATLEIEENTADGSCIWLAWLQ